MIDDEDVDAAEGFDGGSDEGLAIFRGVEGVADGASVGWASAGCGELGGFGFGVLIAEGDFGSGLMEESDGCGSYAARASGDEGYFVLKGELDACGL